MLISPPSSPRAQVSPTSLAVLVQQRVEGLEAVLTVATWEKSVMALQADLLGAYAFGVRHVICRTGTPPLLGDYPNTGGIWDVDSVELIGLLRGMNQGHDRHGIPLAEPTAFVIGARINPTAEDPEREVADTRAQGRGRCRLPDLAARIRYRRAGAPDGAAEVPATLPVLAGIMPLRDFKHAEYLQHEVPGVQLPEALLERMYTAREESSETGLAIARELIERARSGGRLRGVVLSSAPGDVIELSALVREATS